MASQSSRIARALWRRSVVSHSPRSISSFTCRCREFSSSSIEPRKDALTSSDGVVGELLVCLLLSFTSLMHKCNSEMIIPSLRTLMTSFCWIWFRISYWLWYSQFGWRQRESGKNQIFALLNWMGIKYKISTFCSPFISSDCHHPSRTRPSSPCWVRCYDVHDVRSVI